MKMNILLLVLLAASLYTGSMPLFSLAVATLAVRGTVVYWSRSAASGLRVSRHFQSRLFYGETATVRLCLHNNSMLPVPWLHLQETAPAALVGPSALSQAIALRGRESRDVTYEVTGLRRGYHSIGPLRLTLGDVFGLNPRELEVPGQQHLLVYPRLLPYRDLELPSPALFGSARTRRRLIGDPSRVVGVRDYVPGDPMRDIHWQATATAGTLQVKHYQPTTSLQTMIFLDLQASSYSRGWLPGLSELAVSIAATLATYIIDARQEVGLVTNGLAQVPTDEHPTDPTPAMSPQLPLLAPLYAPSAAYLPSLLPTGGRAHLLRVLGVLACVLPRYREQTALTSLLLAQSVGLRWGSTVIVISGREDDSLFLALHQLRERGLAVLLYLAGRQSDEPSLQARARALGVQLRIVSAQGSASYEEVTL